MEQILGLPPDASVHGHQIDSLIVIVHWIMFVLFAGWGSFYLYTLLRFRKSKSPQANYAGVKSHFSNYLEVAVAVVEVILLAGFSIPLWAQIVNTFPEEKESMVIRVVGEQFAWNIHYPGSDGVFGKTDIKLVDQDNPLGLDRSDPQAKDDITTINQLYLPVGKAVIIHLSSKDVIHSFGIPFMRVKQDAIPGIIVPVTFTARKTSYEIRELITAEQSIAPVSLSVNLALGRVLATDYLGKDGGSIIKQGEMLIDSAVVGALQEAGVTKILVTPDFSGKIAMKEYNDKDGLPILAKGDPISDDAIFKLTAMGFVQVLAAPETPMEIACAQLCGLGHFRMRGFLTVQTQEEFDTWMTEQQSALAESGSPEEGS